MMFLLGNRSAPVSDTPLNLCLHLNYLGADNTLHSCLLGLSTAVWWHKFLQKQMFEKNTREHLVMKNTNKQVECCTCVIDKDGVSCESLSVNSWTIQVFVMSLNCTCLSANTGYVFCKTTHHFIALLSFATMLCLHPNTDSFNAVSDLGSDKYYWVQSAPVQLLVVLPSAPARWSARLAVFSPKGNKAFLLPIHFMEMCHNLDLAHYLLTARVSDTEKLKLMLDISKGVEHLHEQNIVHRDIKPNNILVSGEVPTAKLTDFNLSKFDASLKLSSGQRQKRQYFKAPELYGRSTKEGSYDNSVDIFAMGLTFLAMIQNNKGLIPKIETPLEHDELKIPIGKLLWERKKYDVQPLHVIALEEDKTDLLTETKRLIRKMTHVEPSERPSAAQVVQELENMKQKQVKMSLQQTDNCTHKTLSHIAVHRVRISFQDLVTHSGHLKEQPNHQHNEKIAAVIARHRTWREMFQFC